MIWDTRRVEKLIRPGLAPLLLVLYHVFRNEVNVVVELQP